MEVGKLYFFTATILYWLNILGSDARKRIIIDSLSYIVRERRAKVSAFVIMPNHVHFIWQPLDSKVQLSFMRYTAQQIKFDLERTSPELLSKLFVDKKDRGFQVWQRNPLAVELYSREVVEQKLDYIHNNPCQGTWNLVENPLTYAFSSIRFYEDVATDFDFVSHYMDIIG